MILSGVKFVTGTLNWLSRGFDNKEDPEARATAQHVLAEVLDIGYEVTASVHAVYH